MKMVYNSPTDQQKELIMYQTINLMPGVTLRCVEAQHFKQACLSIQFLRPMCWEEVAYNALIPAVLHRLAMMGFSVSFRMAFCSLALPPALPDSIMRLITSAP